VLLINTDSHKAAFANKEMMSIVGAAEDGTKEDLQERVQEFIMQDLDT
jgi:hypothetical protein